MEVIKNFFVNCWKQIYSFYADTLVPLWPFQKAFPLVWVILIAAVVLIALIVVVCVVVKRNKAKKVRFYVKGALVDTVKVKYKKEISFPQAPELEGYTFVGWAVDRECKTPYESNVLEKRKNLDLYAMFQPNSSAQVSDEGASANASAQAAPNQQQYVQPVMPQYVQPIIPQYVQPIVPQYIQPAQVQQYGAPVQQYAQSNQSIEQVAVQMPVEYGPKYYYDEIRYAMLGYERSMQFKKLGVQRKKVIAEMFEKDSTVYLYLAVDPSAMIEKGYKVEKFDDRQFEIVPCKKAVRSKEDLQEALLLVKEAMTVNNLIKSDVSFMKKPSSDEQARKSGFAFFVKNETVATTAEDYYRLLRAIVLSYQKSEKRAMPAGSNNKMILKIYKKEELIYVYLALDPSAENLQNVSFDKNFADTPAMIEIKTAEDFVRTNELIDKLMFRYGMERHPEKAEISLEDKIESSCGFGYRIKN